MQEHNTVVLPHKASRLQDTSYLIRVKIIKRFEFTSQAMKSGAVVVPQDAEDDTALLLVKGAPSVIKHMSRPGSVPENFDRVGDLCAVLCCAVLCCVVLLIAGPACAVPRHANWHSLSVSKTSANA